MKGVPDSGRDCEFEGSLGKGELTTRRTDKEEGTYDLLWAWLGILTNAQNFNKQLKEATQEYIEIVSNSGSGNLGFNICCLTAWLCDPADSLLLCKMELWWDWLWWCRRKHLVWCLEHGKCSMNRWMDFRWEKWQWKEECPSTFIGHWVY